MTVLGTRPHADRLVTKIVDGDREVVVKRYERVGTDAAAVWADMSALWSAGFRAMPEPLWQRGNEVAMELIDGTPLVERRDLGRAEARLGELVDVLVKLHSCEVTVPRSRHTSKLLRNLRRKVESVTGGRRDDLLATIAALTLIAPENEPLVPSHGDFSPLNVLDAGTRLVVIDFDRVQMAARGRDLAYLGAWAWVSQLAKTGTGSWAFGDAARNTYESVTGCPMQGAESFHRTASLVRIVASWSLFERRPELGREVIAEARRLAGST